ncbi:MAG: alanine racemase, partial [Clostridia bacterium]|nr:alanine racemase [Clostridia bacterium]
MSFSIEIDLNAILDNVKVAKSGAKDKKICAVVKANAYGHGAKKVCSKIENCVDYFAVATGEEGKELRKFGICKPILVLSPTNADTLICINYDLSLSIGCKEQATHAVRLFEKKGKSCPIHLQIDSGMHRFGFSSKAEVFDVLRRLEKYSVCGVYSHIYSNNSYSKQINRFIPFERIVKDRYPGAISHLSSTSYVFNP